MQALWATDVERWRHETGTFDERSEKNISTLLPEAQKAARLWLRLAKEEANSRGSEVKIICGTRTYEEQNTLYRQRPKVTNARGQSWRNFGLAWDFGLFKKGKYFGEHPLYETLGQLHTRIDNLVWGVHGNPLWTCPICNSINLKVYQRHAVDLTDDAFPQ